MRFFALALLVGLGISLSAIGCSEPVAPIPAGGWATTFTHTAVTCMINAHNNGIGQVSQDGKPVLVSDGIANANIKCTVNPKSGAFDVQAQALQNGKSLTISVKGISKTATQTAPATGTVSYVSTETADVFTSPGEAPCDFYFVEGTKETISAGSIWVAFDCKKIADQNNTCGISGYAKFENCDGTPPAE